MQINWFTVIAQLLNFLVLVWLLKKYLYKPVLDAIDERENKIKGQLQDADAKKADAQKEKDDFKKRNDDFDTQKNGLMDKAVSDSNAERDKLLDGAKKEADALRSNLEKASKDVQETQDRAIAQNIQRRVLAITKKTLEDLASSSLEEQSVTIFIKRLAKMAETEKQQFIDAFKTNTHAILVQSAFELPAKQQTDINNAVNGLLGVNTQLQFKTAPELISGIQLSTNGYKLAWSMSEYLGSYEKNMLALI